LYLTKKVFAFIVCTSYIVLVINSFGTERTANLFNLIKNRRLIIKIHIFKLFELN